MGSRQPEVKMKVVGIFLFVCFQILFLLANYQILINMKFKYIPFKKFVI